MTKAADPKPRFRIRSLLGIVAFLRRYPVGVIVCLALLLVKITIEMILPQVLGNAITGLRQAVAPDRTFDVWPFVRLYVMLVALRMCVGFVLGPVRNRTIQRTLGDIRGAVYNSLQRLSF